MSDKTYNVIKDVRSGKVFIDKFPLLRNFEENLDSFDTIDEALEKYPDAIVI